MMPGYKQDYRLLRCKQAGSADYYAGNKRNLPIIIRENNRFIDMMQENKQFTGLDMKKEGLYESE